jgi:hypothetical protein
MVLRPWMGLHGPPFNFDFRMIPDILLQVLIPLFAVGAFVVKKICIFAIFFSYKNCLRYKAA